MKTKIKMIKRVTKTEFETSDGEVFQIPFELDEVPTVEEFMDRDLNAAKNLEQLYTSSSEGIYAFGDGSSLESEKTLVSPSLN